MTRWAWFLCLMAACGDDLAAPEPDGGVTVEVQLRAETVGILSADGASGLAIAALDEHRVAVARIDTTGSAYCPDCVGLDPSQCPDVCVRSTVTAHVLDTRGRGTAPITVAVVFLPTSDVDVSAVEVVALSADRVGVAWLDCDNASCMGLFQKQSCTARYAVVDLAGATVGPVQTLYERWFGGLQLAFDRSTQRLLAVVGKAEAFGVGVRRAVFDETGTTLRSPWQPLGSLAARAPATMAADGSFVIAFDDRSPSQPAPEPPCAASCDCLGAGGAELDSGGLFAVTIDGDGERSALVALGRGDDGFYGSRERIAVIDAGERIAITSTQSIDRWAEIFSGDGASWTQRLRSDAPLPVWIGALGTGDALAWLGSEVEPGQAATVQRLVAGTVSAGETARSTFTEPLDRHVFEAAPVDTPEGVSRTFLLQGVFGEKGGAPVWDRFEIVEVEMVIAPEPLP